LVFSNFFEKHLKASIIFVFLPLVLFAQTRTISISLLGNYTTSSLLYLNPQAMDPAIRNNGIELGTVLSTSIFATYRIRENLFLALGIEYQKKMADAPLTVSINNITTNVMNKEGYELIPVELSLVYQLPFTLDRFVFYIGGGVGCYWANHIRDIGDIHTGTASRQLGYGIHTLAGTECRLSEIFSLTGGMKFSDPEITMHSRYNKRVGTYNGGQLLVGQDTFTSKLNVDGVQFFLGTRFYVY